MADLPLLPEEGESLDLVSARFRSKKTGRYTRRVELESIVASIQSTFKSILSIDTASANLVKKAELVAGDIRVLAPLLGGNSPRPEDKPKPKAIASAKASIKTAGMNILGLAGLIGLMKSDRIKAIIGGFFKGLLKGFGMTDKAINALFSAVQVAVKAFELYLGYKVFKSVVDAFMAIKRLADVTGLLSILTRKKSIEIDLKQSKWKSIAEGYRKTIQWFRSKLGMAFKKIKSFGLAIKNYKRTGRIIKLFLRKIIRGFKSKVKVVYKVLKNIKTWKKVVFTALRMMRKGVQVIKAAAAFTLVGYLIGAAVDATIGTAIDYFLFEEKKPGQSTGGFVLELLKKNVISSLTFGMANGESETPEEKTANQQVMKQAADTKEGLMAIASKFAPGLSKEEFVKQYNKKYLSLRSAQDRNTIKKIEDRRDMVWAEYSKKPEVSKPKEVGSGSVPESRPTAVASAATSMASASPVQSSGTGPASDSPAQSSGMAPVSASPATPVMNDSPKVASVSTLSQDVSIAKKVDRQSSTGSLIMNNVNNNTLINSSTPPLKVNSFTIFSDTVGY